MPQINILNILQGDNQSTIVDKINYNFDQILSSGGGPQGQQGLIGPTGPIGPQGVQGVQGVQGPSGTKWFVQETPPTISGITGSNPWTFPTLGDYWLDPDSSNQDVYVFTATGWVNTGYGLNAGEIFQKLVPININGGTTGSGILIAGDGATGATATSVILSDSSINEYTPGGTPIDNINYEGAKLKISTRNDRLKILSFGRSDLDITSGTGTLGNIKNSSLNWDSSNPSNNSFYGISLLNPGGSISLKSTASPSTGGVNIFANGNIIEESGASNITLKTSAINKGIFINPSSNGGFLEFNVTGSSNQTNTSLFVNSTGLGLGIGTGQFKQSGEDSRRLSINGNVSIGKTSSTHTTGMFLGGTTAINYNKGCLFLEGRAGFGHMNPTGDFLGVFPAYIGSNESLSLYPSTWITSLDNGPVLQIKSRGFTNGTGPFDGAFGRAQGRTVIGEGLGNWAFESGSLSNKHSGILSDISQTVYIQPGTGAFLPTTSAISYQHRMTSSGVTGSDESVFAISSYFTGATSSYSVTGIAGKTVIQTINSNRLLEIMSNGSGGNNRINIGGGSSPLLSVFGPSGSPTGGVVIGASASSYNPLSGSLTGSNFRGNNLKNHSLVVTGVQTIGTDNPISLFNSSGINTSNKIGGNSLLKVSRNLYSFASGTNASGTSINNYPNGVEISSYIPSVPSSSGPNANDSVAIAVGATTSLSGTAAPTGFFVSNTGQNIAIGQSIDYNSAIGVSGAGSAHAIKAKGDVDIIGNLSVTGDVSIVGQLQYSSANDILISDGEASGSQVSYQISAVNYDRIFYLSTFLNDLTYNLNNGGFRITIQIGGSNIYNQAVNNPLTTGDWTGTQDIKGRNAISSTFAQLINYSFILPAGMNATIFKRIFGPGSLSITNGPIKLTLHSHKFGK